MWFIPVSLLTVALTLLYWHFKRCYEFFKRLGVDGPPPTVPLGNLAEVGPDGFLEPLAKWREKYGCVFGYFEGPTPVLVLSDPDVIRSILVTDFNNFRERKPFPLVPKDPKGLFVAKEDRWRWLRPLLSPSFTRRKIKSMSHLITDSIDALLEVIGDETSRKPGTPVNIHRLFQGLTLDVIGKTAFGFETNSLRDPNDRLLMRTQKVFKQVNATLLHIIAIIFPWLSNGLFEFKSKVLNHFTEKPAILELREDLEEVLVWRKKETSVERADFLQRLIDVQMTGKRPLFSRLHVKHSEETTDHDVCDQEEGDIWDEPNIHNITDEFTDEEIFSQAFTILLAGYETTANMLAFSAYLLALNPEVQDKLCKEIDAQVPSENMATCENVEKLQYLDMVINEVLRMYGTAGLLVTRKCKEARTYGDLHIPAGTNILIDTWGLHYNPRYWPQPHKFDPDRFSSSEKAKRHPHAFIPFGGGPRNCIGLRFAMIEMKTVLVRVLQKFALRKCSETEVPLSLTSKTAIVPKHGVYVEIEKRS